MVKDGTDRSLVYVLFACWLGWLITAAARQISDIVKREIGTALGLTTRLQISLVVDFSFWIGYIITAVGFGILSDKIGRKKIIYISLFLFSIPTGLFFISDAQSFIYIRFFQGFSVGGFFPVAVALLGDLNEVKNRSKAVGRFVSGGVFGAMLGWLVSGIIYENFGSWQVSFLVFVPPIIGVALTNYFLLIESPKMNAKYREDDSLSIGMTIKKLLMNRFLVIALLFCSLDLFTLWVVDDWIPYFVRELYGISPTDAALFRALSAISGIMGIIFFGYFADKFGRKKALFTAVVCGIVSLSLLLVVAVWLPFEYMYPLSAASGFFGLGEFAAIYVLVMENAPDNRYGTAMGLCIFIGNAIALTGGPLAAFVSDTTTLGLYAFLIVPLIAIILRLPLSLVAKDPAFIGFGEKDE
ncbi:MAG: MFS transporter [Candidatus Helarchaeota archaeon]